MILGVTGHRPDKLPGGYGRQTRSYARYLSRLTDYLRTRAPEKVLTGMALGADQDVCEVCLDLDIPYVACVPFEGQDVLWPAAARTRYRALLGRAVEVVHVCDPGYARWKMEARNHYVVDNSDEMLAVFDGSPGGTANAVTHALRAGRRIYRIHPMQEELDGVVA